MIRSGLIWCAIGFVYFLVSSVAMVCCIPVEAILLGALAGISACAIDKPIELTQAVGRAMLAGSIAMAGGSAGNVIGLIVRNEFITTGSTVNSLTTQLMGQTAPDVSYGISNAMLFGGCILTDLVFGIGCAALAGMVWHRCMTATQKK
jgi:hypothetical protein